MSNYAKAKTVGVIALVALMTLLSGCGTTTSPLVIPPDYDAQYRACLADEIEACNNPCQLCELGPCIERALIDWSVWSGI